MHKVSMQNFLDFYVLERKKWMKYNKTSEPLSGLRRFKSPQKNKGPSATPLPTFVVLLSVLPFCSRRLRHTFLLITLFWGAPRPCLGSVFAAQGQDQSCG